MNPYEDQHVEPGSDMDRLNRLIGETFGNLGFGHSGTQVSYRYWRLRAHAAGNRREEWYAYGTQRSKGPQGNGAPGWWSWVWVWSAPKGPNRSQVGSVTRATRCSTRKRAKAVAYARYSARKKAGAALPALPPAPPPIPPTGSPPAAPETLAPPSEVA